MGGGVGECRFFHLRLGDFTQARSAWVSALEHAPELSIARDNLHKLDSLVIAPVPAD
jgi:hypothetical protein